MEDSVAVVIRSFQAGTGKDGKKFDSEYFSNIVVSTIRRLLRAEEIVKTIVVVTNGEEGNPLAEHKNKDGEYPTIAALKAIFPKEINEKFIIPHVCKRWGPNPGSTIALNQGAEIACKNTSANWILNL